jgi:hypothetical protein
LLNHDLITDVKVLVITDPIRDLQVRITMLDVLEAGEAAAQIEKRVFITQITNSVRGQTTCYEARRSVTLGRTEKYATAEWNYRQLRDTKVGDLFKKKERGRKSPPTNTHTQNTHTHKHKRIQTHTQTQTNTNTHTYIHIYILSIPLYVDVVSVYTKRI